MHPSAILHNPVILDNTVILNDPLILSLVRRIFLLKILGSISETIVVFKQEGSIIGKSCSKSS